MAESSPEFCQPSFELEVVVQFSPSLPLEVYELDALSWVLIEPPSVVHESFALSPLVEPPFTCPPAAAFMWPQQRQPLG